MSKEYFVKRYCKIRSDFNIDECEVKSALRINTLKSDSKDLIKRLKKEGVKLEKIPFLKNGYYYSANFSLGSTPEYLQGFYYLQESASQYVSEILNPEENDLVLDMCAAPGSKTTHLAQIMNNKGTIVALDNTNWRLHALRNNVERCGVENVIIYNKDARYAYDFKQRFDKVLLDAPCSGNFMLEDGWFNKRTIEDIKNNSKVQKQLFRTAISVLKKDGVMVYSTCSLEPEENEDVIEWAKEEFDIKVLMQKRFWPDKDKTQGFFISQIQKLND